MWGLHVNDAYLYMNYFITVTLIVAIVGVCIEHRNRDLKQQEIKWSWDGKNWHTMEDWKEPHTPTDWTETEDNRTDADRDI